MRDRKRRKKEREVVRESENESMLAKLRATFERQQVLFIENRHFGGVFYCFVFGHHKFECFQLSTNPCCSRENKCLFVFVGVRFPCERTQSGGSVYEDYRKVCTLSVSAKRSQRRTRF